MLPATLVTIVSLFVKFCNSSPVYSMQPAYIIANIGTTGRNIRNLPCISRKTSEKGVCMFAIDCLKANGTHLGTCIDRFYFGSCCHILPMHDIVGNTIDTAIIPVREPPSRLSSTTEKTSTTATTAEKITSSSQINTSTLKTTVSAKIVPKPNVTVVGAFTTRTPTTSKPIQGFGERLTTKKTILTTINSSISSQPQPTSSSSSIPQASVAETTEVSYRLTTFQTIEENVINELVTSTKPTKITTAKTQSTPKSTIITTKTTTSRPVPSSFKPKPPSTPFRPRPTHQKPSIRPRPPPSTIKPLKISKPTFKPLSITTRNPTKPTKSTFKPIKITTTKKPIISTKSTTTTITPRTTISRSTQRPITTTILTTNPKPTTTEKATSAQLPVNEKFTLFTELTTRPTTSTATQSSTEFSTTTRPLSTKAPSATESVSTTNLTTVSLAIAQVSITQPNDLPTVSSVSIAVNDNSTTNEIQQVEPLQPPPTTEETNSASFVTWTEETTSKTGTTSSPDWMPITTPDRWVPLPSLSTVLPEVTSTTSVALNNTNYNETTSQKPLETFSTTTTNAPFNYFTENSSTVSSSTTMSTASALPDVSSTITNLIDASSTTETSVNMSDFTNVCGRRMYPEARIVGGERATFGEWPWQISLRQWRTSTYLHKCGAALLNENWAITAAHCVDNVPPSDLLLRLGEHDLSTDNEPYIHQERRVQIVASHPQFDPRTFEYDLALLRFYEPVQFQPNIIPVCVPGNDDNFVGRTAYVTGWGRLYEDGPLPSVLQKVSVPVINNTVCESMYRSAGYIEHIPHIFICAGWRRGGFDSCEGDSGGPMVIQRPDKRFLLAGVISWGIGCAEPNQPGVYTRISEFRDWINQILQF